MHNLERGLNTFRVLQQKPIQNFLQNESSNIENFLQHHKENRGQQNPGFFKFGQLSAKARRPASLTSHLPISRARKRGQDRAKIVIESSLTASQPLQRLAKTLRPASDTPSHLATESCKCDNSGHRLVKSCKPLSEILQPSASITLSTSGQDPFRGGGPVSMWRRATAAAAATVYQCLNQGIFETFDILEDLRGSNLTDDVLINVKLCIGLVWSAYGGYKG
uniref:Uncharacterized protein n=1 Tax=Glossina austeni TaxID=7395 RepID=A0A1A9UTN6_GLOAU